MGVMRRQYSRTQYSFWIPKISNQQMVSCLQHHTCCCACLESALPCLLSTLSDPYLHQSIILLRFRLLVPGSCRPKSSWQTLSAAETKTTRREILQNPKAISDIQLRTPCLQLKKLHQCLKWHLLESPSAAFQLQSVQMHLSPMHFLAFGCIQKNPLLLMRTLYCCPAWQAHNWCC